jgi:hypothetical protein
MMNKRAFFMEAFVRAKKGAREQAEEKHVSFLLILGVVLGVAALTGFAVHFHESGIAVGVAVVGVAGFIYWFAFGSYYSIYCEEASKREALERQLEVRGFTAARMKVAQDWLGTLGEDVKQGLRDLVLAGQMSGEQIRSKVPGVDFNKVQDHPTFMEQDYNFDTWRIREEWKGILRELFFPTTEPTESAGTEIASGRLAIGTGPFCLRIRRAAYLIYARLFVKRRKRPCRKAK